MVFNLRLQFSLMCSFVIKEFKQEIDKAMSDEAKDTATVTKELSPAKTASETGGTENCTNATASPTTNGDVKSRIGESLENGGVATGADDADGEDAKQDSEQNDKSSNYSDDENRKPSIQP